MSKLIIGDTPQQLGQIEGADAMMIDGKVVTKADYLALVAHVEVLKQCVTSAKAHGNILHSLTLQVIQGAELNGSDLDYISESQVDEINACLAQVKVQAVSEFLAFIPAYSCNINQLLSVEADNYAGRIRQEVK
jgi:hypothetical protein